MASLFPTRPEEEQPDASRLPDDLIERGRQAAEQELQALRRGPAKQPSKDTLLSGPRRFL